MYWYAVSGLKVGVVAACWVVVAVLVALLFVLCAHACSMVSVSSISVI